MTTDNLELARQLFAAATALAEKLHEIAASGQNEKQSTAKLTARGRQMMRSAAGIGALAAAIEAVLNQSDLGNRRRRSRTETT
jgi:hypothetical protein